MEVSPCSDGFAVRIVARPVQIARHHCPAYRGMAIAAPDIPGNVRFLALQRRSCRARPDRE
jgi:hypothetical protein